MAVGRALPGPARGLPSGDGAIRRGAASLLAQMAREYGDIASFRLGRQTVVLLAHPDDVEDVLVHRARCFATGTPLERAKGILGEGLLTSAGAEHLRRRRIVQPAFHRRCIAAHAAVAAEHASDLTASWRDGETVDVAQEMLRLALGVASSAFFGDALAGETGLREAFAEAMELYNVTAWTPETREHYGRVRDRLDRLVYGLIAERRSRARGDDAISQLLAAGLGDEELRDELVTLLFAGHETVGHALAWTWHLLSAHPDAEARLHEELDGALGDGRLNYGDVERLPYARAVLSESLRLYPPGWVIGRTLLTPYDVRGYMLPAGTVVLVSQWVTHRDGRWWPDPDRFDPGRWAPGGATTRPKYAYFPFGGGAKQCLGEGFALMEMTLALATVAREWRLRCVSDYPTEPRSLVTLQPRYGLPASLERRSPRPTSVAPDPVPPGYCPHAEYAVPWAHESETAHR